MILPYGQVMWVQWTQRAVRNAAGRVVECQLVGRDVTQRRELDEALRAARHDLEQRVKDRTRDLLEANGMLRQEIIERKRVEQALRESEYLFRQLAENIEEVFWIITPNQPGAIYLSPAFEKVWGRSLAASGSRGQSLLLETIHPEDRGLLEQAIYRQCLGFKTDIEYRILRPDGSIRWIWDRAFPVRGANGQLERIAGLAQDVTLRKQSDEHERIHLEELAHVSRLSTMGEMASGLAHEINQPLAAIHNYCMGCARRLQTKEGIEPDLVKALESAASEAQRAGEIIKRLRAFVKKRPSERVAIAPAELIQDVIQLAEPEILARQTRLILGVAPDLPLIEVDVIQIEQVLLNLIRNALEAMQGAPPDQRVLKILALSPFSESVEFAVVDSGPGLGPSVLPQLFHPFFTTKPEGMGLGLAISRSIIEAHGGTLWGVSPSGGGARFNFRLAAPAHGHNVPDADATPHGLEQALDPLAEPSDPHPEPASGSKPELERDWDRPPKAPSPLNSDANSTMDSTTRQREARADDDPNSVRD